MPRVRAQSASMISGSTAHANTAEGASWLLSGFVGMLVSIFLWGAGAIYDVTNSYHESQFIIPDPSLEQFYTYYYTNTVANGYINDTEGRRNREKMGIPLPYTVDIDWTYEEECGLPPEAVKKLKTATHFGKLTTEIGYGKQAGKIVFGSDWVRAINVLLDACPNDPEAFQIAFWQLSDAAKREYVEGLAAKNSWDDSVKDRVLKATRNQQAELTVKLKGNTD